MQRVFVLDTDKKPLTPCRPKRARQLLNGGKAAVFKRFPFTIILKRSVKDAKPAPLRIKLDPGSKTTGIAIVNDRNGEVVFAAELEHRGSRIKSNLDSRRASRRSRRNRKTRYRKPRFLNRAKPKGWLAPSLIHRVYNIKTWLRRLSKVCNIQNISMELVKFDTQKINNPDIKGKEYQQGTLLGHETREYLLEKWNRRCAYCGKKDVPLEVEHIRPKSKGGSNSITNLTLACNSCNQKKGNEPVEVFLKNKPEILKKLLSQAKKPLRDAAAVNATRWNLFNALKRVELPVECGSGGLTKFNRTKRGFNKSHWLDAACVGKSTPDTLLIDQVFPLHIKATGHGSRQMCSMNKFGFPRTGPKSVKVVKGFRTGDIVKATVTSGKKAGIHIGRVVVRKRGSFSIKTKTELIDSISWKYFTKIHGRDGYTYYTNSSHG